MDAAYVFGNIGNLSNAMGAGWSIEDAYAWAVGPESKLTLPLQDDKHGYVVRFDIHPAIFPPKVLRQRLKVLAGDIVLGEFELTGRGLVAVPLPLDLTVGAGSLLLTLVHPDFSRPSDHRAVDDARSLALCFHSVTLARSESPHQAAGPAHDPDKLEPVHGVMAGDATALRICEIIGKLPSLKGQYGIRFLDLSQPLEKAVERLPPGTLETMQFCWHEANAGSPASRDSLRKLLPVGCARRSFFAPVIESLWPFGATDASPVQEEPRRHLSRYPYGDRLANPLAAMNMPDDVVYLMYDMSAERETLDLDEMFESDLRRWRAEGKKSDMDLAGFIERRIASDRVFIAPKRVGPALLREMVDQVLDDPWVADIATPEVLAAELDSLLDGYQGWQEEVPVHKRVATHFKLSWWSPDMDYRWMNNLRTYRQHTMDYIRWAQWRP